MKVRPHERFSSEVTLTTESVAAFAHVAGDQNPLHFNPIYASTTRYKRLVASGTQTTSLLMGLTATYFSHQGAMVGLEFWFRFRRPIYADETIWLEWLIVSVKAYPHLGGEVVDMRGRIRNETGKTAVGAKGRILFTEQL
jgi:3-hydroxybutyryl-CoA dehydratase